MRPGPKCSTGPCLAAGAIAALLAACATPARRVDVPLPAKFEWDARAATPSWPTREWFRDFGSAELTSLMSEALQQNLDLQGAAERVVQADARARQAHAAILPGLELNPATDYLAGHSSSGSAHELDYGVMLTASYEVDFWGKNRAKADSAAYLSLASRADRDTVRLTTEAAVASTYFEVVSLRERLTTARANIDSARQVLGIVQSRFKAGYAAPVEVATQTAAVASLEAAIPELEQSQTRALSALAVLLGRAPESFTVQAESLSELHEPTVAPGMPAELLRRRPDIALAEANLASAHADLQAARAAMFPSLTLTAAGGVQNPAVNAAVNTLAGFGPSLNLSASVVQTIFDAGRLRAQRREAESHEQELLIGYRASILSSLVDVENALSSMAHLDEGRAAQVQFLAQSERALEGARARYERGSGDLLSTLQAQTAVFAARDQLNQYRLARLQASVSLFKALGGGWQLDAIDAPAQLGNAVAVHAAAAGQP